MGKLKKHWSIALMAIQADGGFAYEIKDRTIYLPCHGADTLHFMICFGQGDDLRAKGLLDWLFKHQSEEGGWPCEKHAKGGRWGGK